MQPWNEFLRRWLASRGHFASIMPLEPSRFLEDVHFCHKDKSEKECRARNFRVEVKCTYRALEMSWYLNQITWNVIMSESDNHHTCCKFDRSRKNANQAQTVEYCNHAGANYLSSLISQCNVDQSIHRRQSEIPLRSGQLCYSLQLVRVQQMLSKPVPGLNVSLCEGSWIHQCSSFMKCFGFLGQPEGPRA